MKKEKIWIYAVIILLSIILIVRFFDQSNITQTFPLDYTNDMASYMAQLYFLSECGYHASCPYWYNGFTSFLMTMPGWYFFSLPLYFAISDIKVAFFISLVLIYVLSFIVFMIGGKGIGFSPLKSIAFFLLFLANAQAIGDFIRLGRVPELFAWLNFVIIAFAVLKYKNKPIRKNFLFLIIPLSVVLLSHQTVAILTLLTLLSLLIIKAWKERIYILISIFISIIVTAFWWIPYLLGFSKTASINIVLTETLFIFSKHYLAQSLSSFIIPFIFIFIFFIYWKRKYYEKKELLFFIIPIILSILLFTRLITVIPLLRYIYPDVYLLYFVFFASFMLLSLDSIKWFIIAGIIVFVIASVLISLFYTPWIMTQGELEKEAINSLDYINGSFLLLGADASRLYSRALYSYAGVYKNLSTPDGWYTAIVSPPYY